MSDQDLTQAGVAVSEEPAVELDEALAEAEEKRAARKLAKEQAAGLRALADFVEANPTLAKPIAYALDRLEFQTSYYERPPAEELAEFARAGLAARAKVAKQIESDKYFQVELSFGGGVKLRAWTMRERVCERVVVSTETVTKAVPDPVKLAEVPLVDVEETVETVEWVCSPLLAATGEAGAS